MSAIECPVSFAASRDALRAADAQWAALDAALDADKVKALDALIERGNELEQAALTAFKREARIAFARDPRTVEGIETFVVCPKPMRFVRWVANWATDSASDRLARAH